MTTAYHETRPVIDRTWVAASLVVMAVHFVVGAYLVRQPPADPKGAIVDAVLVDLTPPKLPPAVALLEAEAPPLTSIVPPSPAPEPPPVEAKPPPEPMLPPVAAAPPQDAPEPVAPPASVGSPTAAPTLSVPPAAALPVTPAVVTLAPSPSVVPVKDVEAQKRQSADRTKANVQDRRLADAKAKHVLDDKRRLEREAARQDEMAAKAIDRRTDQVRPSRQSQAQASSPATMGVWQGQVRARISANVTRGEPGSATVVFTVTGAGRIAQPSANEVSPAAIAALAAVRRTGSVPAPPDHRPHSLSIRINVNQR